MTWLVYGGFALFIAWRLRGDRQRRRKDRLGSLLDDFEKGL